VGPEIPVGRQIPRVYRWLQQETAPDTVVVELPFQGPSEFQYEYYSSHHWRRLANGGTGFTPPIYKEMREWFKSFPDPRSVDVMQQLGIDLVILHPNSYTEEAWAQVLAELPLYLPAIDQIQQIDDALVLRLAGPLCQAELDNVNVQLSSAALDGLSTAVMVSFHNRGPAAFVADVARISHLDFGPGDRKPFTEPLVTPAGEAQAVTVPLTGRLREAGPTTVSLTSLGRTVSVDPGPVSTPSEILNNPDWQPLGLQFSDGPRLGAYSLMPIAATGCENLAVALDWENGRAGDRATMQLLDPFGRVVIENVGHPWPAEGGDAVDVRTLPLVGPLPAGRYGLRLLVHAADGTERLPVTDDGVSIPSETVPPLPVNIQPASRTLSAVDLYSTPARFDGSLSLLGRQLGQDRVSAGDWLRFSLVWQAEQPLDSELTVFTQLIGPDGQVWGQRDNRPGGGWYDVSQWPLDVSVIDDYAFQIETGAPPGLYRLIAGLYHSDNLERLRVESGDDFVEIGTVLVE
jgi:hypothetical protein